MVKEQTFYLPPDMETLEKRDWRVVYAVLGVVYDFVLHSPADEMEMLKNHKLAAILEGTASGTDKHVDARLIRRLGKTLTGHINEVYDVLVEHPDLQERLNLPPLPAEGQDKEGMKQSLASAIEGFFELKAVLAQIQFK